MHPRKIGTKRRAQRNYPPLLLLFAAALMMAPLLNLAGLLLHTGTRPAQIPTLLGRLSAPTLVFFFAPTLIAVGLLLVNRAAWYALLLYATALTGFNTYALVTRPVFYNLQALVATAFGLSLMLYFLRKDVYAPFYYGRGGGWRAGRRVPVRLGVVLDGVHLLVRDLSTGGMFVFWASTPLMEGDEVTASLTLGATTLSLPARVARATKRGVGLQFTSISRDQKKVIRRFLRNPQEPSFNRSSSEKTPASGPSLPA